jgi:cytochrome c oxidase subunit 3
MSVRFDANVSPGLGWKFEPESPEIKLRVGQTQTVFYKITNRTSRPSTGIATYNIAPEKGAAYFVKIQCFCFTEHTLQPGEMAGAHTKNHDYHLVDPSPWPLVGAASATVLAIGAVMWMKAMSIGGMKLGPLIFGVGMLGVLYTMLAWWMDVIREAEYEGHHTRVVQMHHRYGMMMFIASEVMFFVAWFWAYFDASLFPARPIHATRVSGVHRRRLAAQGHRDLRSLAPAAAQHADPADLGHHGDLGASRAAPWRPQGPEAGPVADGDARHPVHLRAGLRVQPRRPSPSRQHLRRDLLHGDRLPRLPCDHRHDLPGGLPLRAYLGHFTPKQHLGFEFAAWYWHFVDVVWLFLFASIYVWGGGGPFIRQKRLCRRLCHWTKTSAGVT